MVSALGTNLANTTAAINAVVPQLSTRQVVALASTLNVTDPSDTSQIATATVNLSAKARAAVNSAITTNAPTSVSGAHKIAYINAAQYCILKPKLHGR